MRTPSRGELVPVVLVGADHVAGNLLLALAGHQIVVDVLLEAADQAGRAVLDARAKLRQLVGARALERILEVDVLSHSDFRVEQRSLALVRQLLALLLQATDDPGRALQQIKM